jgi:hypothetical protein
LRRLYRDLLRARRHWPALRDFERRSARLLEGEEASPVLELLRGAESTGGANRALFNLGDRPRRLPGGVPAGATLLFSSEAPCYGGSRREPGRIAELLPFECVVFGPSSFPAFPSKDQT